MQTVWAFCKGKTQCDADEPKEENDGGEQDEVKKGHGGCGAAQPQIRKEGLKLFVQYKRSKDEDEVRHILQQPDPCLYHVHRRSNRCSLISGFSLPTRCILL